MENKKKILIVDDEMDIIELLKLRLQINGFSSAFALNGEVALEEIEKEKPDLILLDIKMPKLNGYKVTKVLKSREATRHIPILIITAYSKYTSDVAEQCQNLGVQGVFYKPFDSEQLIEKIRSCLGMEKSVKR